MKPFTSSLMLLLLAACTVIPEESQGGEETLLPPAGSREMVVEAGEPASKTTIVPSGNIYYGGDVKFMGSGDTLADFHLSAGSSAIGHGVSASYLSARDHDGKIRGASFDSGAYQY